MFCKVFKTNLTQSQQLEKHEKQTSNTDFSHICLLCTAYRQLFLVVPHRLRVSVGLSMHRLSPIILSYAHRLRVSAGLAMYRLSPIILGCAQSSSCVSWFAYAPLIANYSQLRSSSSRFSWFGHVPLIANNSWLRLVVFVCQLVCPCTAYRQ